MAIGRFIVFEGGEASGKSTQAALLASAIDAVLTREPGGTPLGESLRTVLLDRSLGTITPRAELLMMAAARAQHVEHKIRPALASGQHVVCDRFTASTLAYQGYGRGLPLPDVLAAAELATSGLSPDLWFLLDIPLAVVAQRRARSADRIEAAGPEFHARVLEGYRTLAGADPSHCVVIDGSRDVHEVARHVRETVRSRLGLTVHDRSLASPTGAG